MNLSYMPIEEREFFREEFWAPPMNFQSRLTDKFNLQERIYVHDATLRDGEQTPGVAFTIDEKIMIAHELDKAGVGSIELGLPVISKDFEVMKVLAKEKTNARMTCLVRAKRGDIDKAVEAGISAVVLEHSINPYTCKLAYDLEEKGLIDKNVEMIKYAQDQGLWVNWMGWDSFRSDRDYIKRVLQAVVAEGDPEAVTVADTFGMLHPLATFGFFTEMRRWFPDKLIELHEHNDLGMATANALSAITAGANAVHTAVNGLGERAGNISLEEIVTVLKGCFHIDCSVDLSRLKRLSKLVEQISKVKIPDNKPIVGDKLFRVESGLIMHIFMNAAKQGFPATIMQPFLPEMVGQEEMEYVIGKGAGKTTIEYFLDKIGVKLPDDKIHRLIDLIKKEATIRKSCLSIDEFKERVKSL